MVWIPWPMLAKTGPRPIRRTETPRPSTTDTKMPSVLPREGAARTGVRRQPPVHLSLGLMTMTTAESSRFLISCLTVMHSLILYWIPQLVQVTRQPPTEARSARPRNQPPSRNRRGSRRRPARFTPPRSQNQKLWALGKLFCLSAELHFCAIYMICNYLGLLSAALRRASRRPFPKKKKRP